jgi:hypothetical protein
MKWNRTPTKEKASGPSPQVKPQRQLDHEEWLWNTRVWSNMAVEPGQNCSPLTMHLAHNVCQGIPRYTNGWILPHFQTCPNWSMTTTWTHIYAVLTQASRTIQDWWNSVFKHLPKLQLEKPPKKKLPCSILYLSISFVYYNSVALPEHQWDEFPHPGTVIPSK